MKECEYCEEEIPQKRLLARPGVKLCVICQEDEEKSGRYQKHKMSVDIRFKGDEIESYEQTVVRFEGS